MIFNGKSYNITIRHALLCLFILFLTMTSVSAGELDKQRVWAGLELFPTMLAADSDIAEKKDADNRLHLLVVYRDRKNDAEDIAGYLNRIRTVRGIELVVHVEPYNAINDDDARQIAGVFLTQKSPADLDRIIRFGEEKHAIVFSPFPGDIERGVTGGILVSDMIQPYVNMDELNRASIRLKPFFLRVAEQYGE